MKPSPPHGGSIPEHMRSFTWAVGVECSVLPHIQADQFQWSQHDIHWREDFRLIKDTFGAISVRYCLPWNMLEPKRGRFEWAWADERVNYITQELGLKLILDVMHFGTPLWLASAVGDPEFPEALEQAASQLAARYGGRIDSFCPMNEPLITALFSGDLGFWPPHGRKWRGYMPVLSRVVQGTLRATRAIRREAPDATVILCDSCEHHHTHDEQLLPDIQMRNLRRFAVLDLMTGKVDQTHPLYKWFTSYGLNDTDLNWIRAHRSAPDVIGLDYYSHTETQLEAINGGVRQRQPEQPLGLYGCAKEYWNRYGIPLMVTETSIEDTQLQREMWMEQTVFDCKRLRDEGIPLIGYTWWPFFDNVDWDGALLHHIGKIHNVGLVNLKRQKDGSLKRVVSGLSEMYSGLIKDGEKAVGLLGEIAAPALDIEDQDFELEIASPADNEKNFKLAPRKESRLGMSARNRISADLPTNGHTNGNGKGSELSHGKEGGWGIVVFCHLRWGFVWQRPQQFISRFAKTHPVLFIEEPIFDLADGDARLFLHRVMPNVVVACPHFLKTDTDNKAKVFDLIPKFAQQAIKSVNEKGHFDAPVLYYYNPMDVAWSLGRFNERAVVYDCMDELSQFKGAPKTLLDNEARLLKEADIVFAGGHQMYLNKSRKNENCHFFGCGVDTAHFGQARAEDTPVPPDIDFMPRPILGWFGVIDERVDYPLLDKLAEVHPDWSIAMIGPVVKIDPSLLPHRPNLYWLGGRDYRVLPNYCKAFNVCLMPFAINDATQYINPTKALEYMGTARPIVSTPVTDVVRNFGSVVKIGHTHAEFIKACEESIAKPDSAAIEAGLAMAEQNTWHTIVNKMLSLLHQAVDKRALRGDTAGTDHRSVSPRIETDEGVLEISWSYPSVAGS